MYLSITNEDRAAHLGWATEAGRYDVPYERSGTIVTTPIIVLGWHSSLSGILQFRMDNPACHQSATSTVSIPMKLDAAVAVARSGPAFAQSGEGRLAEFESRPRRGC